MENTQRVLKFRAWHKKEEIMLSVNFIDFTDKYIAHIEGVSKFVEMREESPRYEQEYASEFKDIELMQYTGFKDSKGVEIYEGDILKVVGGTQSEIYRGVNRFHVIWNDNALMYEVKQKSTDTPFHEIGRLGAMTYYKYYEYEVIGNIYENPELLEEKK